MKTRPTYNNLVFSGGAFKAISFIGCLQYLEENALVASIYNVIGSSAGTIIALLFCIGCTTKEMLEFIRAETAIYMKNDEIDVDSILEVFDTMGLDDGSRFIALVERLLERKSHSKRVNFLDLAKKTGKNFVVCASNISKASSEYFSVETTPAMMIVDAIRISISVPIIMTPVILNDMVYVDAGIFNNFPIEYFEDDKNPFVNTLSLIICDVATYSPSKQDLNLFTYMRLLFESMLIRTNAKTNDKGKGNDTIKLYFDKQDEGSYGIDLQTMKMKIDATLIDEYSKIGYATINGHFTLYYSSQNSSIQ